MVCKECGKEIPEGRMYCDDCLGDMEAQEPEVITISRAQVMKAEKKMRTRWDLVGYVKALPKKNLRLIMLLGAVLTVTTSSADSRRRVFSFTASGLSS